MSFKTYVDMAMKNFQVDDMMKTNILNSTVRMQGKKGGKLMRRKILIVVLAAVMCLGTVAVGAQDIKRLWDETIAKMFTTDVETQQEMIDKGYAQVIDDEYGYKAEIVCEGDEISVIPKHIFAEKYSLRIYFHIKSNNGMDLADLANWFDENILIVDGECIEFDGSISTIISGEESMVATGDIIRDLENQSGLDCGYMITLHTDATKFAGKEVQVKLKDLSTRKETIKGDWNFTFNIEGASEPKTFSLDSTWTFKDLFGDAGEKKVKIKSIEIYPLTYCINYEMDGEKFVGYICSSGCYDLDCIPVTIVMKDGKVYSDVTGKGIYSFGESLVKSSYENEIRLFSTPIDIEEIDYIEVNGEICYVE